MVFFLVEIIANKLTGLNQLRMLLVYCDWVGLGWVVIVKIRKEKSERREGESRREGYIAQFVFD